MADLEAALQEGAVARLLAGISKMFRITWDMTQLLQIAQEKVAVCGGREIGGWSDKEAAT